MEDRQPYPQSSSLSSSPPPSRPPHILIVAVPTQSHLNPALQLGLRLVRSSGARVTLATTVSAYKRIKDANDQYSSITPSSSSSSCTTGLHFATFSDGYDDGYQGSLTGSEGKAYIESLRRRGTETLSNLINIQQQHQQQNGFDYVVYTILLHWAGQVARQFHLPSALLWVQPAATLSIYYYYLFNQAYADIIDGLYNHNNNNNHHNVIRLPGLPCDLSSDDLPTFFSPSTQDSSALSIFRDHFQELELQPEPHRTILINTFDALEFDSLTTLSDTTTTTSRSSAAKFKIRGVGPLLSTNHRHSNYDSNNNNENDVDMAAGLARVDLFKRTEEDYLSKWLDSKQDSSVVYVSFGSIAVLSISQVQELAHALLHCGRPFLWAIRPAGGAKEILMSWLGDDDHQELLDQILMKLHKDDDYDEKQGCSVLVVAWCSQVDVLSHKAVGCFVTHCGWNSTLEALSFGVPVVGIPQWNDQVTNAKMLQDVWKIGLRAKLTTTSSHLDDGEEQVIMTSPVVDRDEIRRCVQTVMADQDMRNNASRWKELAAQALQQGGSSDTNLAHFVNHLVLTSTQVSIHVDRTKGHLQDLVMSSIERLKGAIAGHYEEEAQIFYLVKFHACDDPELESRMKQGFREISEAYEAQIPVVEELKTRKVTI